MNFRYACFYSLPLIFSFNGEEHLNEIILLAPNVNSLPFEGFRPLRSFLSDTLNLPNPEMRMSSPDSSVFLMMARVASASLMDFVLEHPQWLLRLSIMCDLVSVMMDSNDIEILKGQRSKSDKKHGGLKHTISIIVKILKKIYCGFEGRQLDGAGISLHSFRFLSNYYPLVIGCHSDGRIPF
jgi:hypothetical protein